MLKVLPIIIGVTLITFGLIFFSPVDPAEMHFHNAGYTPTQDMLEAFREQNGLNKGFIEQYTDWWKKLFKGDLGESYDNGRKVSENIGRALPYTVSLAVNSMLLTLVIAFPLGFYMAMRENSVLTKILSALSLLTVSLPSFIVALIFMYVLSSKLKLLPILTDKPEVGVIMPSLTLAVIMSSRYLRQIRTVAEEELKKDHIYGLRARGISDGKILLNTVLKNTAVEIITIVGLSLGSLMGGVTIIETIFNWPGLGKLMTDSVMARDMPMIQGTIIFMSLSYVLINLITDILYGVLDPRIRLGGEDDKG